MTRGRFPGWTRALIFPGAFLFFVYLARHFGLPEHLLSDESLVRHGQFNDLAAAVVSVRESAVASAWFPPLPLALRAPFALFSPAPDPLVPGWLLAAFFNAATIVLLEHFARRSGHGFFFRLFLVLAWAFHPLVLAGVTAASDFPLAAFVVTGAVGHLFLWQRSGETADCILMSVYLSAAAVTLPGGFLLAPVFLLPAAAPVGRDHPPGRRAAALEGISLLVLLPTVYILFIWALFNWLLLGDWLYFLRGFPAHLGAHFPARFLSPETWLPAFRLFPALLPVLGGALVLFAAKRRPAELFASLWLACALVALPLLRPEWPSDQGALAPLLSLAFLVTTFFLAGGEERSGRFSTRAWKPVFLIVLVLNGAVHAPGWQLRLADRDSGGRAVTGAALAGLLDGLPPGSPVVTTGYQGYFLARLLPPAPPGEDRLRHHFVLRTEKVYPVRPPTFFLLDGNGLFLLSDGIYRDIPGVALSGAPFLLLEKEMSGWKLFRVIFLPRNWPD